MCLNVVAKISHYRVSFAPRAFLFSLELSWTGTCKCSHRAAVKLPAVIFLWLRKAGRIKLLVSKDSEPWFKLGFKSLCSCARSRIGFFLEDLGQFCRCPALPCEALWDLGFCSWEPNPPPAVHAPWGSCRSWKCTVLCSLCFWNSLGILVFRKL